MEERERQIPGRSRCLIVRQQVQQNDRFLHCPFKCSLLA
jgi:hypothetical protein